MKRCILNHPGCEGMTEGSVGAAGIRWNFICQNCKDIEDEDLARCLKNQARLMDELYEALSPTPLITEEPQ
jgi:hypothetical protein